MKVLELKEKAKSLGIKGYYKMKKQELLDAIKAIEEKQKPVSKDQYYCILTKKEEILRVPIIQDTLTLATQEFFKLCKTNPEFKCGELFCNDRKIRQRRQ
jgi:hypothetical protein